MVNKILPKDINLLLNKLIIIIRKISVNCGKKNKKLTRVLGGLGGFGLPSIFSNTQDKNLENEINSFLQTDYTYSLAFFKNLNTDYLKNPNKFFTKENINPKNQSILHSTNIANYEMIPDIDKSKIDEMTLEKNGYVFYAKNLIIYKNYNGEIKYISFNESIIDKDIMILHLKYIILYNKIYNTYDNNNINFGEIKETVGNYINFYEKKSTDRNIIRINDDSIISFYNYVVYILSDISKLINKRENIDIERLKYYQNKGGKTDLVILKHAAIYNIGNILISILSTLNNI